ncbi:MAG: glycoside hydrolase family 18 protein, partial [Planctomycetales bacterium]|nr:glycoside hydrolase family 18 protein [Planctomycetales bacterium]
MTKAEIAFLLTLAAAICAPRGAAAVERQFVVVGYLPEYRVAEVAAGKLAPVTDLVYFGLAPPADGRIPSPPVAPQTLRKLHEIKRTANCRLLLCVGGWNRSAGFAQLVQSEAARRRFIAGLTEICRGSEFDGVDFDWEHPQGAAQVAAYARLLAETKAAFAESRLLVTVAQAEWQDLGEATYAAVDRVHLMSYDHAFPQATFAKSKADVDRLV